MQPPPARVPSREIANVRPSYQPRSVNRASSKVSPKSTPAAFVVDSAASGLTFVVESKAAAQNAAVRVIRRLRVGLRVFMISLAYSQKWRPQVDRRRTGCDSGRRVFIVRSGRFDSGIPYAQGGSSGLEFSGSRFEGVEVLVKDARKLLAVAHPVRARGVVLQAGDPVDVELVGGRVDAVALQPALAERPGVPERFVRAPLGEPRVLAEQPLQRLHAAQVSLRLGYGRSADMELTLPVVVQLQRQVRALPSPDHPLQPGLQGVVLRRE